MSQAPKSSASQNPPLLQPRGCVLLGVFAVASITLRWLFSDEKLLAILSSPIMACIWDFGWASAFVGSIYVWKYDFPMNSKARDMDNVILQRFLSVGLVTTCFVLLSPFSWSILGFPISIIQNVAGSIIGILIVAILFTGPLVFGLLDPESEIFYSIPLTLSSFRTIIFAPFIEELAFRSCMIPVMLHSGFSPTASIYITPLFFGLAHVHHMFSDNNEKISIRLGEATLKFKVVHVNAVLQATYTTVFGWIASFIYLHTGSTLAAFTSHAFCNYMGLPSLDFIEHPKKIVIGLSYIAGVVGFFLLTSPLVSIPWIFTPIHLIM